jgi:hypothetical protein
MAARQQHNTRQCATVAGWLPDTKSQVSWGGWIAVGIRLQGKDLDERESSNPVVVWS